MLSAALGLFTVVVQSLALLHHSPKGHEFDSASGFSTWTLYVCESESSVCPKRRKVWITGTFISIGGPRVNLFMWLFEKSMAGRFFKHCLMHRSRNHPYLFYSLFLEFHIFLLVFVLFRVFGGFYLHVFNHLLSTSDVETLNIWFYRRHGKKNVTSNK